MRHIVVPVNLMLWSGKAVCLTTYIFLQDEFICFLKYVRGGDLLTDRIPSPPTTKSANACVPSEKFRLAPPSGRFSIDINSLRS